MQVEQGTKSLTQVVLHTNVHCCHWLPKELSNKGYQTYQRFEHPENTCHSLSVGLNFSASGLPYHTMFIISTYFLEAGNVCIGNFT